VPDLSLQGLSTLGFVLLCISERPKLGVRSKSQSSKSKGHVAPDLSLRDLALQKVCDVVHLGMPEAQSSEVNLSRPNQKDTWRQISHFGDLALWKVCDVMHLGTPEARSSEVNLSHPNQKDTWHQISHFGDLGV
jgi:hypothetical protein